MNIRLKRMISLITVCALFAMSGCSSGNLNIKPVLPHSLSAVSSTEEGSEKPHVIDTDFTRVSSDVTEYLAGDVEEFTEFAQALNSGETGFTFSSKEVMYRCQGAMSALLSSAYVESYSVKDDCQLIIKYNESGSKIRKDLAKTDEYIQSYAENLVGEEITDFEKAAMAYRYFSEFSFDASVESPLKALETKSGTDYIITKLFCAFLNQFEIDTRIISCTLADGSLHYFAGVKIEDKFYAFDPVLENEKSGGSGLDYFFMSSSRAQAVGLGALFYSGLDAYFSEQFTISIDTGKDKVFKDTELWSLDTTTHILYMSKTSDNYGEFSSSFNSATLSVIQG
ncbi:MAG: transglutaminase domain-containing protein [Clostridia bacterium]|nr:transglutaminase domain-containing protein [Clostridia bacterium]